MKHIVNFFFELGMLKKTPRSGFQFLGSGRESVAEHVFRVATIGFAMARLDKQADAFTVVRMCLFHDIPEARTGDLNYVNKKYVQVDELKAVADLAENLPFGDDYQKTLEEFIAKETYESQIAHDADQLEMVLSLKERKDLGNRYADEWYPFSRLRLKTEVAKQLAETIWETDSSKWWFDDDHEWWVKGTRE